MVFLVLLLTRTFFADDEYVARFVPRAVGRLTAEESSALFESDLALVQVVIPTIIALVIYV